MTIYYIFSLVVGSPGPSDSYTRKGISTLYGHVAVIDPIQDWLIKRIPVEANAGPMAMDPTEKRLYVVNTGADTVTVIGHKAYVANFNDRAVTIINTQTNKVITKKDMGPGKPFAFASNEKSSFVYVACRVADGRDYIVAFSIEDNIGYQYGNEFNLTFDETRNPLTVSPDGNTQITLGTNGILCFLMMM